MFYGHAMLIGGKPERIEIFIVSGLSLSRPVDTKADSKLNNIIATPSSNLILMPKLVSIDDQRYAALTLQSLRVTIGPLQASTTSLESQESYLTAGMLPYNRNVTLQTFLSSTRDFYRLHSTFARLYNAAASPASRLRSAGSLAINILLTELSRSVWENLDLGRVLTSVLTTSVKILPYRPPARLRSSYGCTREVWRARKKRKAPAKRSQHCWEQHVARFWPLSKCIPNWVDARWTLSIAFCGCC